MRMAKGRRYTQKTILQKMESSDATTQAQALNCSTTHVFMVWEQIQILMTGCFFITYLWADVDLCCHMAATVECPAPPTSITNGHLLGETGTFTVGQSVTYLCDLGYRAQGLTTLTCQASGDWSASTPVCVGKWSPGSCRGFTVVLDLPLFTLLPA